VSQSTSDIGIVPLPDSRDVLGEILRQGAREMLAKAIQTEVADWIDAHAHITDSAGRRQVVRNGSHPEGDILTGLGPIAVQQPRVLDRRPPRERETFTPNVLPPTSAAPRTWMNPSPGSTSRGSAPATSPKPFRGFSASKPRGSRRTS
jgi:putative transposase